MLDSLREKHFERWLGGYLRALARRALAPRVTGTRHLLVAICDHYEPLWGRVTEEVGVARVNYWCDRYPRLMESFRDADGKGPQHSFFFPGEEFRPRFFDSLDRLVEAGAGEVELHLHHDDATEASARAEIESYLSKFAERGHLSRESSGRIRYGFIHGNWCLANARPDGRWCGVDAELPLLFETGCYADFTFPAVPDVSQPNVVNQIYWPVGNLSARRAYEHAERARVGHHYQDRILMVQGPLGVSLRDGSFKPRLEYAALTANDPATPGRVATWVRQNVHVAGRPEWLFVKLHTHGAPEAEARSLLGAGGDALHECLTTRYNDGVHWQLHYVTAREMYNIARAAMAGEAGNPNAYRDYELAPPPIRNRSEPSLAEVADHR